jgi:hypothetical protein
MIGSGLLTQVSMGGGNCIRNSVQYLVERQRLRGFSIKLPESLEVDLGEIFCFAQIEDPKKRKSLIISLLDKEDSEQLKLIFRVLSVVIH